MAAYDWRRGTIFVSMPANNPHRRWYLVDAMPCDPLAQSGAANGGSGGIIL
jgi:hypothetical protein